MKARPEWIKPSQKSRYQLPRRRSDQNPTIDSARPNAHALLILAPFALRGLLTRNTENLQHGAGSRLAPCGSLRYWLVLVAAELVATDAGGGAVAAGSMMTARVEVLVRPF